MTIPPQDFGPLGIKDPDRSKGRSLVPWEGPGRDKLGNHSL